MSLLIVCCRFLCFIRSIRFIRYAFELLICTLYRISAKRFIWICCLWCDLYAEIVNSRYRMWIRAQNATLEIIMCRSIVKKKEDIFGHGIVIPTTQSTRNTWHNIEFTKWNEMNLNECINVKCVAARLIAWLVVFELRQLTSTFLQYF